MKKLNIKEILVPTVSLFLICAVVTLCLSITNSVTAPKIAQLQAEREDNAKKELLTSASQFGEGKDYILPDGRIVTAYDGTAQSKQVGRVYRISEKGYGGDITMMIGVDLKGEVTGITFLSISETAGLGMNADTPKFKDQFKGKTKGIGVNKGNPSENEIQAITGATITSTAVTNAVNHVLELHEEIKGEGI